MLARVVNDDAGCLMPRGGVTFFASVLAPTGGVALRVGQNAGFTLVPK
jgi:hypothetical protein